MSTDTEFVLADLVALDIEGPCMVFIRPKALVNDETMKNVAGWCQHMTRANQHHGATFVPLPYDIDVMAVGEAQMRKLGWTKVDISPTDKLT